MDQFPAWVHATFQYTQHIQGATYIGIEEEERQHELCRRHGRFIPTITQSCLVLRIRP